MIFRANKSVIRDGLKEKIGPSCQDFQVGDEPPSGFKPYVLKIK